MSKNSWNMYKNLALLMQIGITMTLYIVASIFLGNFLDNHLGTSPLLLLVFIVFGIIAAFYNVFKLLIKIGSSDEDDDKWKK